jgi:hypothetical protein
MQLKEELIRATGKLPLIVYYQGNYEDIPTETLVSIIESNEKSVNRKSQLRKVMFLSVEAIQNIQRYSAHQGGKHDFYLIFFDGESYQVVTQNLIYNKDCQDLKNRLDTLISKDQTELEELYVNQMDSGQETEKGAGLGLIEITRKSNRSIQYDIKQRDEEYSLFNLYFAIPLQVKESEVFDFSMAKDLQAKLNQLSSGNESCFYYGGDFSNNFIFSLLNLLLSKKAEQQNNVNKKVHHIIIELTQNLKRHAHYEKQMSQGKMFIEWKNSNVEITTYNEAQAQNAKEFQKKVVDLNSSSKEQLLKKSKDILSDLESTNGLGLIDIANLIYPNKMNVNLSKDMNEMTDVLFNITINNE